MNKIKTPTLTFPEGVDDATMSTLIGSILDGIDRDRLFQDERLTRVRHPLLAQRIGEDVALNTEIHNLFMGIVTALSASDQFGSRNVLLSGIPHIESILLDSAKNLEVFGRNLTAFEDAVIQLSESNQGDGGAEVQNHLDSCVRYKLKMPNPVQDLVLYPAVTTHSFGKPASEVLEVLGKCRDRFLEALGDRRDDLANALRGQIATEVAAVEQWLEGERVPTRACAEDYLRFEL